MSTKNTVPEVLMVTDDQIGHIKGLSDKALRALPREQANAIIRNGGVYNRAYDEMLQRVLAELTNTVTVIAKRVDYSCTPMQVIRATGRAEYVDEATAKTMPRRCQGIVENVEVEFFRTGRQLTAEEQEQECATHNLDPDAYAQAEINKQDPSFADKFPNGTQWDRDGKVASYLAFGRWFGGGRRVDCRRDGRGWGDDWWCSGVRKVSPPKAD